MIELVRIENGVWAYYGDQQEAQFLVRSVSQPRPVRVIWEICDGDSGEMIRATRSLAAAREWIAAHSR
jgi:hypothetical protein